MFVKISDFNYATFNNLWGGFSCDCIVDETNKVVSFYRDGEAFSLYGSEAEDVLDFVLSEYYENEDTIIEDGFSNWLESHYKTVTPPSERDNLEMLYDVAIKELKRQDKIIKSQKKQIKRLKERLKKASNTIFNLRKELEILKNK